MRLAAVFAVAFALLLGGCLRYEPIDNVDRPMPPNAEHMSQDRIRDLIVNSGRQLEWVMTPVGPGHLEATHDAGKISATVDIYYTPARLQILLKSSRNLFQTATTVHGHYNLWIRNLEKQIIDDVAAAP